MELTLQTTRTGKVDAVLFSLASDASNKENPRLFPNFVRYFDRPIGKGV
jgi:hypothetical protein